jgi:hypothetical protein
VESIRHGRPADKPGGCARQVGLSTAQVCSRSVWLFCSVYQRKIYQRLEKSISWMSCNLKSACPSSSCPTCALQSAVDPLQFGTAPLQAHCTFCLRYCHLGALLRSLTLHVHGFSVLWSRALEAGPGDRRSVLSGSGSWRESCTAAESCQHSDSHRLQHAFHPQKHDFAAISSSFPTRARRHPLVGTTCWLGRPASDQTSSPRVTRAGVGGKPGRL